MTKCIYKNRRGRQGEEIAKKFLLDKGLIFLKANYRYERAEIDLIFKDEVNKIVIFAEVKTRTNKKFGEPEESINKRKQEQILKAAQGFVIENPEYEDYGLRLDSLGIMISVEGYEVNHIESAFW